MVVANVTKHDSTYLHKFSETNTTLKITTTLNDDVQFRIHMYTHSLKVYNQRQ